MWRPSQVLNSAIESKTWLKFIVRTLGLARRGKQRNSEYYDHAFLHSNHSGTGFLMLTNVHTEITYLSTLLFI